MDFLQQQGIQVQVIPGITAAFGIAAELFPWTLRGVANSVRFLTGNSRIGGTDLLFIAKDVADPNSTLVIYMGLSNLPSLAKLPYHGLPLGTPAAAVEHETTPQQHVLVRDRDIATQEEGRRERRNEGPSRHVECDVVSRPRGLAVDHSMEVCWEKFARYFEVELKEVKLKEGYYVMDPVKAVEMIDENAICVAAILGPTLTGEFEDVKLLNDLLTKKNKETGQDTPIHVGAASGGLIAPFLYPHLKWDFHLPLIKSIMKRFHRL